MPNIVLPLKLITIYPHFIKKKKKKIKNFLVFPRYISQ